MKNILLFLAVLSLSLMVSCNGGKKNSADQTETNDTVKKVSADTKKKENDLSKYKLKGEIKTRTENYYRVVKNPGGYTKGEIINKTTLRFNTKGYKTEEDYYNTDGSLKGKWIFKYDADDRMTGMERYNAQDSLERKYIYEYDNKGNMTGETVCNADKLEHKNSYLYDYKGNLLQYISYNPDGGVQYKSVSVYNYDDRGNKTMENNYSSYGYRTTLTFDSKGNRTGSVAYKSDGSIDHREIRTYDKGFWLGYTIYNADGSIHSKAVYKNNDKGDRVEENQYRSDGSLERKTVIEYEYDKIGNMIKCDTYEGGALVSAYEFEIEYY
ncbi:MAG TPA: hypothetical protein PKW80_16125 [Bacteroidales bacterium]|nr:hypothetical protein [Bacteroidales bacterium]